MGNFCYFPQTEEDIRVMLERIGVDSLDALYSDVPADFIYKGEYDLPDAMSVEKMGGSSIKDALCDGNADLTIDHIGAGQANTTELCINHTMIDVQLADETMAALCEQGYDYVTVPAGTWQGQDVDILTVGSQQCIIVSADMEDEVAYNITKALCENKDILVEASAVLGNFNPEVAGSKALTGCDLHPGAAKYYEEMGYAFN